MITRRQFLTGAAVVVAATATGCTATPPNPGNTAAPTPVPAAPVPAAPAPETPVRIALLSDPHSQWTTTGSPASANPKLVKAVADMKQFKPDYWICNGDVADGGLQGQLEGFRDVLRAATPLDRLFVTTGNHEFYDTEATDAEELSRFRKVFGKPQAYSSHVVGSVHFVLLADEQWKTAPRNPDWAWITPAQLQWFEQVLAEHRDKCTAVFLHQPIQDTVLWTTGANGFAGSGQVKDLKAIIARNPQIRLWFSGHTHQVVEAPGQVSTQGKLTYVALASTYYNFVPANQAGGSPRGSKDFGSSQTRFMEIFKDRVTIRARDNVSHTWLPDLELTVTRA